MLIRQWWSGYHWLHSEPVAKMNMKWVARLWFGPQMAFHGQQKKIGKALKLKLRSCYLFCSDFCGVLEWWTLEQGLPVGFLSSKIFKLSHSFSISHVLKGSIYYRPAIIFYIRRARGDFNLQKRVARSCKENDIYLNWNRSGKATQLWK